MQRAWRVAMQMSRESKASRICKELTTHARATTVDCAPHQQSRCQERRLVGAHGAVKDGVDQVLARAHLARATPLSDPKKQVNPKHIGFLSWALTIERWRVPADRSRGSCVPLPVGKCVGWAPDRGRAFLECAAQTAKRPFLELNTRTKKLLSTTVLYYHPMVVYHDGRRSLGPATDLRRGLSASDAF